MGPVTSRVPESTGCRTNWPGKGLASFLGRAGKTKQVRLAGGPLGKHHCAEPAPSCTSSRVSGGGTSQGSFDALTNNSSTRRLGRHAVATFFTGSPSPQPSHLTTSSAEQLGRKRLAA